MKAAIARLLLRIQLPRLLRDSNGLNRLMGSALRLQLGTIDDDRFRTDLDAYYASTVPGELMAEIDFAAKSQALSRPDGYKVDVSHLRSDDSGSRGIWGRRFGLLRRLGVRTDLLVLPEGKQIPPHGHYRVVSGFYVLEGRVAIRHFDRVREDGDGVWIRPAIDAEIGPGGFATNSERFQNIHWLCGRSPRSFLFRVTVSGAPIETFGGAGRSDERVYVDPSGARVDAEGLLFAPYICRDAAEALPYDRPSVGMPEAAATA